MQISIAEFYQAFRIWSEQGQIKTEDSWKIYVIYMSAVRLARPIDQESLEGLPPDFVSQIKIVPPTI